jgi:hypothetical protein
VLILFGLKTYVQVLGVVSQVCRHCGTVAGQRIEERVTKLTIFFVPTITTRRAYVAQCSACTAEAPLSQAEAERLTGATPVRRSSPRG